MTNNEAIERLDINNLIKQHSFQNREGNKSYVENLVYKINEIIDFINNKETDD